MSNYTIEQVKGSRDGRTMFVGLTDGHAEGHRFTVYVQGGDVEGWTCSMPVDFTDTPVPRAEKAGTLPELLTAILLRDWALDR